MTEPLTEELTGTFLTPEDPRSAKIQILSDGIRQLCHLVCEVPEGGNMVVAAIALALSQLFIDVSDEDFETVLACVTMAARANRNEWWRRMKEKGVLS